MQNLSTKFPSSGNWKAENLIDQEHRTEKNATNETMEKGQVCAGGHF